VPEAEVLGNTADTDIEEWLNSLRNVSERFPDCEAEVPRHGNFRGKSLIHHTIGLFEKH
jgi:hypothetical protein